MKKIITALLLAGLLLGATSCVTRGPGESTNTTTNLKDILSQIDDEIKNPSSTPVSEVIYKVNGDHVEVVGCTTAVGEIKIESEYEGKKVTAIADEAFNGLMTITSIVIPEGITTIGAKAFMGCGRLESVALPSTLTELGRYAFYGCSALSTVEIPVSLTTIGSNAFGLCAALKSFTVAEGSKSFSAVDGVLFSADKSTLEIYPTAREDKSYAIPDSVKTVANFAFSGAVSLESVSMTGVTSLGDYTFRSCARLKDVDLGTGLKFIGASTFQKCTALTEIVIPEGVESIGYVDDSNECGATFSDCTALTTLTLPASLKHVYRLAFSGCTALSRVNYGGTNAEWSSVTIGEGNEPLKTMGVIGKN